MLHVRELMFQNWVPDPLHGSPFRPKRGCPKVGPFRVLGRDCRPSAGRTLCRCYSRSSQSVVAVLGAQMRSQDSRRDGAWRVAKHMARLGIGTASRNKNNRLRRILLWASHIQDLRSSCEICCSVAAGIRGISRVWRCLSRTLFAGGRGRNAPKRRPPARYGKRKLNDCCLSLTPHCLTEPLCLMQLLELLNPSSLCQSPSNKCDSQVMGSEPFRPQFQNSRVQFGHSWYSLQPSSKEWDWISRQTCFHSSRQPKPKEFARPLQQTREVPWEVVRDSAAQIFSPSNHPSAMCFCVLHGFCKSNHVHWSVGTAPSARHDLGTAPVPLRVRRGLLCSRVSVPRSWPLRRITVHRSSRGFSRGTTTVCESASHSQPEQEGNQTEPISTLHLLLKHWQVIRTGILEV